MAWIKVEHELPDKPEVAAIAARLGLDQDTVATKCIRLWVWFERNTEDGNAKGVTESFVDRYVFARGFAQAMVDAGWLVLADGFLTMPKFSRHTGKDAKRRAQSDLRVHAHREKKRVTQVKRKCNAGGVAGDATPLPDNDLQDDGKGQEVAGGGRGGSAHSARNARASGQGEARAAVAISDLSFPAKLDTPEARDAMNEWLEYKRARGEGYKRANFAQKMLNDMAPLGPDVFVASVNRSIGNNYSGMFPAKESRNGPGKPRDDAGSIFNPDAPG